MKKIVLLSILISMIGFSCSGQGRITEKEKKKIQEVIENHDKTLIFVGAKFCHACKSMLEKNIKPYLEGLEKNDVGIVIIYYGGKELVADLVSNNRLIITENQSLPLLARNDVNKTMKNLLKDFRETNVMPIPLLVDKDGLVLNYDEEDGFLSYAEIIKAAE